MQILQVWKLMYWNFCTTLYFYNIKYSEHFVLSKEKLQITFLLHYLSQFCLSRGRQKYNTIRTFFYFAFLRKSLWNAIRFPMEANIFIYSLNVRVAWSQIYLSVASTVTQSENDTYVNSKYFYWLLLTHITPH